MLPLRLLVALGLALACGIVITAWADEHLRDPFAAVIVRGLVLLATLVLLRGPVERLRGSAGWWRRVPASAAVAAATAFGLLVVVHSVLRGQAPRSAGAVLRYVGEGTLAMTVFCTALALAVAWYDAQRSRQPSRGRAPCASPVSS